MANIVIKELFGSDNISTLTEKLNFNFDQLIIGGGGPEGPQGDIGGQGVAGPEGIRGSQWFGDSGTTGTINDPTDGVLRENDFKLNDNGDVVYFNNSIWNPTGLNLTGPAGPQGQSGDGTISTLPGLLQINPDWGSPEFTPDQEKLGNYLSRIFTDDKDDYDATGANYINAGVDFITMGRGNNSLVLGRYATLFRNNATGSDQEHSPQEYPGAINKTMQNFPVDESNVPMLIIGQNDYKDPSNINETFENGIAIGLNKTQKTSLYNTGQPYGDGAEMNFDTFTKIKIENRFFDFGITSKGMLSLVNLDGSSNFRLGLSGERDNTNNVHDISTKITSKIYTEFNIADSFVVDLSDAVGIPNKMGVIMKDDYFYNEARKEFSSTNDYRQDVSKAFFTGDATGSLQNKTNEIVLSNTSYLGKFTGGVNDRDLDKFKNDYNQNDELNPNNTAFPFRIGQTVVDAKFGNNSSRINLSYLGQGYETALVSYSGIDYDTSTVGISSSDSINGIPGSFGSSASVFPVGTDANELQNYLGYDIKEPVQYQQGSRSVSRIGLYPGLLRQEKENNTSGNWDGNDSDKTARQLKFFDTAHKMLPTGSADFYGTVRLRQQETTDNGSQDGYVAINKKDGIVTFEEPNLINAVPSYSIMMFGEHCANKFSFFTHSSKNLGYTGSSTISSYLPGASGHCAAFIGKGSEELKDYFICNGAVLADSRDILVNGPFARMKGMNVKTPNSIIENGVIGTGDTLDYDVNEDFVGADSNGYTQADFVMNEDAKTLGVYAKELMLNVNYGEARWGYSVLAPAGSDSGFRVVLPNYFGKVAKMILPGSDFLPNAVSGAGSNYAEHNIAKKDRDTGWLFYTTDSTYNISFMLSSSFDEIGSPYLSGMQMPRMKTATLGSDADTGRHAHEGFDTSISVGDSDYVIPKGNNYDGNFNNTTFFDITGTKNSNGSFNKSYDGHRHLVSIWAEYSGKEQGLSRAYTQNFWWGEGIDSVYNKNSNWIRSQSDGDGINDSISGQSFITPPFKGTYLAVNLKGVRNPLRNSTLIDEFHPVAGIPIARSEPKVGNSSVSTYEYDMSWYSHLGEPELLSSESQYTSSGYIYSNTWTINSGFTYNLNAYKYNFKAMHRNEDTQHPYTFSNPYDSSYTSPIEYNNEEFGDTNWRQYTNMLYKTSMKKSPKYDVNKNP